LAFGDQKLNIFNSFLKGKQTKNLEKTGIFTKNWILTKLILVFDLTLKKIVVDT